MPRTLERICLVICLAVGTHGIAHGQEPEPPHIRSLAFSPDGKSFACGIGEPKQPGPATVWDVSTRRPLWTHREDGGVPAVTYSPDGQTLAAASYNGTASLLDAATGTLKSTLRHPKEVRSVAFSPDGKLLATACWDGLIRVWNIENRLETLRYQAHKDRILSVAYSADGRLLLSAGGSDGAKLWDAATGKEKHTWKHGSMYVSSAAFSPDSRWAITGGYDGTVRLWDVSTGELRDRFTGVGGVNAFAFSPSAGLMAVCGYAPDIALFPLTFRDPSAQQLASIHAHLNQFDADSYAVRESASKGLLELGFVAEPELHRAMKESPSVEVRIRSRRVIEGMLSKPLKLLRGHTEKVDAADFSPDGKMLASGGTDGTIRLWEVATGKELARFSGK